jgi:hypothetical protein
MTIGQRVKGTWINGLDCAQESLLPKARWRLHRFRRLG